VDEFRIWYYYRTPEEITRDMQTQMTGTEAGLMASYSFDDPPGSAVAVDSTGNGHDLHKGGCAPCEDGYKGWGFDTKMRQCKPSAQHREALYFEAEGELVFGAAHCYADAFPDGRQNAFPASVESGAPILGTVKKVS
jgi:hypothetical protein